ncbi:MAG: M14/M99 family metallopeptidase [Thermodesulfobacteriota bacterium]
MRRRRWFFFWLLLALLLVPVQPVAAQNRRDHEVYFQDTPYELNVYRIFGRKEGPTMLIIGGIQGDEPGGFLSADLYTDMSLKRGNLIVVPRANFHSILLFKRGLNGDMNRMFGQHEKSVYESRIVQILEKLIAQSDILLNLHDGSGFYRPTYINELHGPNRYGQSIIADCEVHESPRTGHRLELGSLARKVIAKINAEIDNPAYHFHFMNTRTSDPNSPYAEQRTSATYYALTRYGIPAFGVETSKNLPSMEMKVHQHNLAINAFMELFGLVTEQPRIYLENPQLKYMVISVNGQIPVAVADGQTLNINPGDTIEVIHVEANYDRGLSADIQGFGSINDFRQPFAINKPTFIVAQKDHIKFGRVAVALRPASTPPGTMTAQAVSKPEKQVPTPAPTQAAGLASGPFQVKFFILEVEGRRCQVPHGGRLEAVEGDRLKLVDVETQGKPPSQDLVLNFRGFVSNARHNTGEDRGHEINTAKELLPQYSVSKTEKIYEVALEQGKTALGLMTVRLNKPTLDYVVFSRSSGQDLRLKNGQTASIRSGDRLQVTEIKTNIPDNRRVELQVLGQAVQDKQSTGLPSFELRPKGSATLLVVRDGLTLGKVILESG